MWWGRFSCKMRRVTCCCVVWSVRALAGWESCVLGKLREDVADIGCWLSSHRACTSRTGGSSSSLELPVDGIDTNAETSTIFVFGVLNVKARRSELSSVCAHRPTGRRSTRRLSPPLPLTMTSYSRPTASDSHEPQPTIIWRWPAHAAAHVSGLTGSRRGGCARLTRPRPRLRLTCRNTVTFAPSQMNPHLRQRVSSVVSYAHVVRVPNPPPN